MPQPPLFPALTAFILLGSCASAPQGVTLSVADKVQPVLIRNPQNRFLEVKLDAANDSDVRVQSLEFSLEGTESLADLDSIEVYSGETMFGAAAAPAAKVEFRGEHKLQKGVNSFWLSCRLKPDAALSRSVTAKLLSVKTSGGELRPAPGAKPVRHRIGIALRRHNDDNVHTYRIPALATGPDGTLYSVYDMRRRKSRDLQEDIDIGLSRSVDAGANWEPVRVIMDMGEFNGKPQEENGVSDPGIVVDQKTGEIFVFAVWMWGKPGKHQWNDDGSEPGFEIGKSAQLMMVKSRDKGLTWSKPENLTRKLKRAAWWLLAPAPQQGINLPDGTLVLPAQGRDEKGVPFATIMVSRDHGANWTVGEPAFSGGNECQAVQLLDGSIMLNMRNDHERFRAVFTTSDLGRTWREHETNRKTLIEPNCNGSICRVDWKRGAETRHLLLFANPHSQKARTHHTVQVSFDDGKTWPGKNHLLLDEGRGRGYPSLSRIGEDHVGIVYEGSQADVVFEKIALEELVNR